MKNIKTITGVILWYNEDKGYGYANSTSGLIFLRKEILDSQQIIKRHDVVNVEFYEVEYAYSFIKVGDLVATKVRTTT